MEECRTGLENPLRTKPLDIKEQFERQIKELQEAYGEAMLELRARKKLQPRFAQPIKAIIEENPSFGYRAVAHLLDFNKNIVQRVFQLMGWQVKKRPIGFRPRIQALPSVAQRPNERWATDLCRVCAGRDGWAVLALVVDCHTRELLG